MIMASSGGLEKKKDGPVGLSVVSSHASYNKDMVGLDLEIPKWAPTWRVSKK